MLAEHDKLPDKSEATKPQAAYTQKTKVTEKVENFVTSEQFFNTGDYIAERVFSGFQHSLTKYSKHCAREFKLRQVQLVHKIHYSSNRVRHQMIICAKSNNEIDWAIEKYRDVLGNAYADHCKYFRKHYRHLDSYISSWIEGFEKGAEQQEFIATPQNSVHGIILRPYNEAYGEPVAIGARNDRFGRSPEKSRRHDRLRQTGTPPWRSTQIDDHRRTSSSELKVHEQQFSGRLPEKSRFHDRISRHQAETPPRRNKPVADHRRTSDQQTHDQLFSRRSQKENRDRKRREETPPQRAVSTCDQASSKSPVLDSTPRQKSTQKLHPSPNSLIEEIRRNKERQIDSGRSIDLTFDRRPSSEDAPIVVEDEEKSGRKSRKRDRTPPSSELSPPKRSPAIHDHRKWDCPISNSSFASFKVRIPNHQQENQSEKAKKPSPEPISVVQLTDRGDTEMEKMTSTPILTPVRPNSQSSQHSTVSGKSSDNEEVHNTILCPDNFSDSSDELQLVCPNLYLLLYDL